MEGRFQLGESPARDLLPVCRQGPTGTWRHLPICVKDALKGSLVVQVRGGEPRKGAETEEEEQLPRSQMQHKGKENTIDQSARDLCKVSQCVAMGDSWA